jgi:hypothetical protein
VKSRKWFQSEINEIAGHDDFVIITAIISPKGGQDRMKRFLILFIIIIVPLVVFGISESFDTIFFPDAHSALSTVLIPSKAFAGRKRSQGGYD